MFYQRFLDRSGKGAILLIATVLLLAGTQFSYAQTAETASLRIEQVQDQQRGQTVDLSVTMDTANSLYTFGGFDILVSFPTEGLSILDVYTGDIFSDCAWEYYTCRSASDPDAPDSSVELLRIVGIAKTEFMPSYHPTCLLDSPYELFRISFRTGSDSTLAGKFLPVRFAWRDCRDNIFITSDSSTLVASDRVFDHDGYELTGDNSLPGYSGAPTLCSTDTPEQIDRGINFYNGGIGISPVDHYRAGRGDLNLNGVAFEPADWQLLADYLQYGESVFTIDPEHQIAASDINADGIPLTIEDLTLLYDIIRGISDTIPPYPLPTESAIFSHAMDSNIISFTAIDSLATVILVFDGNVAPTILTNPTGLTLFTEFDGQKTRVMIYPDLFTPGIDRPGLPNGPFLSFTGDGTLIEARTADYNVSLITTVVGNIPPPPSAILDIEWVLAGILGKQVDVTLSLRQPQAGLEISKLNLLVEYNPDIVTLVEVQPGSTLTACGWESFEYYADANADCDGDQCPEGTIRIIAAADSVGQGGNPACYELGAGELANLKFDVIGDPHETGLKECPVKWTWYSCADNAVTTVTGDSSLLSRRVFDYGRITEVTESKPFPNATGAPDYCFTAGNKRQIDFNHGLVYVYSPAFLPGLTRGDLNLNSEPYEIFDYTVFKDYLLYGDSVWFDPDRQIPNSDVNANWVPLELDDYVYLARVINGDAIPYPRPSMAVDTLHLIVDHTTGLVSFDYALDVSAFYIKFDRPATIEFSDSLPYPAASVLNDTTRVLTDTLFFDFADWPYTTLKPNLFTVSGAPLVTHAEASWDGVRAIPVAVDYIRPAAKLTVTPQPFLAAWYHAITPVEATLYIGNLDSCTVHDIDLNSILVDGSIAPMSTEITTGIEGYAGDVIAATFDAREFINQHYPFYDTVIAPIAISWSAPEGCLQSAEGTVTMRGHARSDVNLDGQTNISDLTRLVTMVFVEGAASDSPVGDVDGSGACTISDILRLAQILFSFRP